MYVLAILLTGAVFAVDLFTPLGMAVWLFYLIPVLVSAYWLKKRFSIFLTASIALLILMVVFIIPREDLEHAIFNRVLAIIIIIIVETLLLQRRSVQERLKESEERYFSLFSTSNDAIILAVLDQGIKEANPAACALFGYSVKDFREKTVQDLIDLSNRKAGTFEAERKKGGYSRGELTLVKSGGEKFEGEIAASSFTDSAGRTMTSYIIRDITQRKELERERRDLAAMITHDLKSPLTSILAYSEILSERLEGGDLKEMLRVIHGSGERMLGMVEDFLTASKMETGTLDPAFSTEDISVIISTIFKDFLAPAERKGIKLVLSSLDSPRVDVDRKMLSRALANLIQNALNYTPEGGTVLISATAGDGEFDIAVKDTGTGVAPEERDKIFQKHYRSHRTAGVKGAGLGLAIVKAVAEAHGGKVELESEPGKGSTFRLKIPLRKGSAAA